MLFREIVTMKYKNPTLSAATHCKITMDFRVSVIKIFFQCKYAVERFHSRFKVQGLLYTHYIIKSKFGNVSDVI